MKLPKWLKNFVMNSLDDEELMLIIFKALHYFKDKTDNKIDDLVIEYLVKKFDKNL